MEDSKIQQLRANYDAYNRCDFDAIIETSHPDIVLVRAGGQGEVRGTEALRSWMEPDAFESQQLEPATFQVAHDKVLVYVRSRLRGACSGIEMEIATWTVWTFDESGRITRIEIFLEHQEDEARRAFLD